MGVRVRRTTLRCAAQETPGEGREWLWQSVAASEPAADDCVTPQRQPTNAESIRVGLAALACVAVHATKHRAATQRSRRQGTRVPSPHRTPGSPDENYDPSFH